MNTFILFYALVIFLVVQFFAWSSESVNYYRSKKADNELEEIEKTPNYLSTIENKNVFKRLKYSGKFTGMLRSENTFAEPVDITVYYETTLDPREHDVEKLIIAAATPMNVSFEGDFQDVVGERRYDIARDLVTKTGLNRWLRDPVEVLDGDLPPVEELKININRRISTLRDFDMAYSEAFRQSDALEDGFPVVLYANLGVIYLDRFMADTISSSDQGEPTGICLLERGVWLRFGINEESSQNLKDCDDFITIEHTWQNFLTRDLSVAGRSLEKKIVPHNTLLITSLLPTATFYAVIVLFAISTRLFSSLLIGTGIIRKYVLRAPLSIACFAISIPVSLYSIWF